jgi:small-conductance mechanosensitive channel
MKPRGETIFSLILLAVFVIIVGLGMGYSKKARMLPLVLGIPGVVLTAVIVTRNCIRTGKTIPQERSGDEQTGPEEASDQKKVLAMIGWVALLIGMIWVFGFVITIPVYMILFLKTKGEKWLLTLCLAAGSWVFLYWIFAVTLKIILFPGILFE